MENERPTIILADDILGEGANKDVTPEEQKQIDMDGSPPMISDVDGYVSIKFQLGPIKEVGVNGTTIEEILKILMWRLTAFQKGPFRCRSNAVAITKIQEALMWLEERTKIREFQNVEGTNQAHTQK
uniref:Putative structural protein n=1 Tax=viral metagenome TaxID=1070528 RepID=A0A6M3L014_9ZZZZ